MEKTLSAYSDEHINEYFNRVKKEGLTEHGFPILTANIGILIAHGRRHDLLPLFLEMMEFSCKSMPMGKAENDFSVSEVICCIIELEKTNVVDEKDITRWKNYLKTIEVKRCYNQYAEKPTDFVLNWGLFTCLSEFYRQKIGLANTEEFVDIQIPTQLRWLDANGMYKDNAGYDRHQPIIYDLVGRYLFSFLLFSGYRGKFYKEIDDNLRKAGLLTLDMQSISGEVGFGGRSNQFVHNEGILAVVLEYEARRYKEEGNLPLAIKFKTAADRALKVVEKELSKTPISHVKNRFPIDSGFGCEEYAYFDKYMIAASSKLYLIGMISDESIPIEEYVQKPIIWHTTSFFHKTFVNSCGYTLEFDTNSEPTEDASGLGRIHKEGAPSTICLSTPFPIDEYVKFCGHENNRQFSICAAVRDGNGNWVLGADSDTKYVLADSKCEKDSASVTYNCTLVNGEEVSFSCSVNENGVTITATGDENKEIGVALAVFEFDGSAHTKITYGKENVLVEYEDWVCEYVVKDGYEKLESFANRNGLYKGIITSNKGKAVALTKIYPKK